MEMSKEQAFKNMITILGQVNTLNLNTAKIIQQSIAKIATELNISFDAEGKVVVPNQIENPTS